MDNLTRDVIADLYPLYVSGDVSPDSRRLVEAFLSQDPEFARALANSGRDSLAGYAPPPLQPDHELKTLARLKRRLWGPLWMMNLAIMFSCFAFGRIVADTSWDVSPRPFIVTALIAVCFWVAFFVSLFRGRRTLLVRLR
jgi:anti-sigma factor RsiW